MDISPEKLSRVWLKGAFSSALKGIPQGILLGVGGALLIWGLAVAFPALGLVSSFGTFLFTSASSTGTLSFASMIPFVALNTVLTVAGNFLTGGKIAVNAHKQEADHEMNEARISQIEAREAMMEQTIIADAAPSRAVQNILTAGPRGKASVIEDRPASFAEKETARESQPPLAPTLH